MTDETARLQRVLSDLIALIARPAAWTVRDPADVIGATLDTLVAIVRLEFAAARLDPSITESPFQAVRLPRGRGGEEEITSVSLALDKWVSELDAGAPRSIPNPLGDGAVFVVRFPLGLHGEMGDVIAASSRPDFPTATDRLVVTVAINQAAMILPEVRRRVELEQIGRANAREAELRARFDATLEERTRIAREIHDTLLQGFTGITLHLAALSREQSFSSKCRLALVKLTKLAQRTLTDGRHAVWGLRMSRFDGLELEDAIQRLAAESLDAASIRLRYEATGFQQPVGVVPALAALRIVQEALANVVTHAGAREVCIGMAFEAGVFRLRIADDGCGFTVEPDLQGFGGHWGLIGMRERASEAGGSLFVRSEPAMGTEITATLPYRDQRVTA